MDGNFQSFTNGELLQLVDRNWIPRITRGFISAIRQSFIHDGKTFTGDSFPTENEVKRRFKICMEVFCMLRRDLNRSVPRILDELPVALRHHLDGTPWNPEPELDNNRKLWVPGDPLDFMK